MVLVMEEVKEVVQVVVVSMAIQKAEVTLDMALIMEEWEMVVMEEGEEALTLAMEEEKALVIVSVKEEVRRKLSNGRDGQVGLVQFLVKVIKEDENKSLMGVAVDIPVVADNLLELVAVDISVAVVKLLEMVKVAMMVRAM